MHRLNGKIFLQRLHIKLSNLLFLAILAACLPSLKQEWRKVAIIPIAKADSYRLHLLVESSWKDLGKAKYMGPSLKPKALQDSGFIQFYYYLRSFISMGELSRLLGIPIFVAGPHGNDSLEINDTFKFGFYHPEFPIRLRSYLIPAISNSSFRSLTQANYDSYVKRLARTFFVVYQKLNSNPEFYEKEVERYTGLLKERRLDPYYLERFVLFMKTEYTDGEDLEDSAKFKTFKDDEIYEEDLVKQVVGFWIRRRIDKTDFLFFQGLSDLIHTYDQEFQEKRLE